MSEWIAYYLVKDEQQTEAEKAARAQGEAKQRAKGMTMGKVT